MGRKRGIPGLSFSLQRAFGISAGKRQVSKNLGIPINRPARQRRVGATMGCCVAVAAPALGLVLLGLHLAGVIA